MVIFASAAANEYVVIGPYIIPYIKRLWIVVNEVSI
jgi:hypothetical protein